MAFRIWVTSFIPIVYTETMLWAGRNTSSPVVELGETETRDPNDAGQVDLRILKHVGSINATSHATIHEQRDHQL